jgi:tetratricopeptide (TPR) repeat protein
MPTTLSPSEEAQLAQTIEMFEVITQSQPQDYQSLEILKEAYSKLGRETDVVGTSKRIAQAYVQMGQLSSAILEYETILQRFPDDPDVQGALKEIETKASNFPMAGPLDTGVVKRNGDTRTAMKKAAADKPLVSAEIEDGRKSMYRLFVDSKVISAGDFELCWPKPDAPVPAGTVVEPFIGLLADKSILPEEKALKMLSDKSRCAFLPLQMYDVDIDLARTFPAATCQRWCVMPFDRMSKSILVATANPFNQQAAKELAAACGQRLLWYLAPSVELLKNVRKAFR